MEQFILPEGYHSPLTIRETEVAIKEVKDHFERALAKSLHLTRVSAPLFVKPESGLNDNLNGTSGFFWNPGTERCSCGDRTLSRQVETICFEAL